MNDADDDDDDDDERIDYKYKAVKTGNNDRGVTQLSTNKVHSPSQNICIRWSKTYRCANRNSLPNRDGIANLFNIKA